MAWRDAQTTTDVSTGGFSVFQTAYLDAQGNIDSFTTGDVDNQVKKYFSPSLAEVRYKRSLSPILFILGQTKAWTWDGSSLTETSMTGGDTQYGGAVMFAGKYYMIDSTNNLKVSTDLTSWTDTTEDALTIATDGTYLVAAQTASATIRYSTDGTNWSSYSSFSPGVKVNAVRFVNNLWTAVGYYDDTAGPTGYKLPWSATCSTPGGSWTQNTMGAVTPSMDISILDVSYRSGVYWFWSYVSANGSYMNYFTPESVDGLTYETPDFIGSLNNWGTGSDRGINDFIATPNGLMVAPVTQDSYFYSAIETNATWSCYPGAQDKNGKAYTITWDNNSASDNFWLVDENNTQVVLIPGAAYVVGGYR